MGGWPIVETHSLEGQIFLVNKGQENGYCNTRCRVLGYGDAIAQYSTFPYANHLSPVHDYFSLNKRVYDRLPFFTGKMSMPH